eukprot:09905_1
MAMSASRGLFSENLPRHFLPESKVLFRTTRALFTGSEATLAQLEKGYGSIYLIPKILKVIRNGNLCVQIHRCSCPSCFRK